MSRLPRRRLSTFSLSIRLTSQRCSASWRRKRATKQLARERRRTVVLGLALDSSLLRQKELEQRLSQAEHRLLEMQEARQFRTQGSLPEPPQPFQLPSYSEMLDR